MLRDALGEAEPDEVTPIAGGLVNTVYRVTAGRDTYALRISAAGRETFDAERTLLERLAASLPTPAVRFADGSGTRCRHLYTVYRWIDGIPLNQCRRETPDALASLAEPLGRTLARVAGTSPSGLPSRSIARQVAGAVAQLRAGPARDHLGGPLADTVRGLLEAGRPRLIALDHGDPGLVHGDFGGRNVLVRAEGDDWVIAGLLDWECARAGAPLWDVGSLFRYSHRYPAEFRDRFAAGYRAEGGPLPHDWWLLARLLDSSRLVAILSEPRDLADVVAECRALIDAVVCDFRATPA